MGTLCDKKFKKKKYLRKQFVVLYKSYQYVLCLVKRHENSTNNTYSYNC